MNLISDNLAIRVGNQTIYTNNSYSSFKIVKDPNLYNILRINNPNFIEQSDKKLLKIDQYNFILNKLLEIYYKKYDENKIYKFSLCSYSEIKSRKYPKLRLFKFLYYF